MNTTDTINTINTRNKSKESNASKTSAYVSRISSYMILILWLKSYEYEPPPRKWILTIASLSNIVQIIKRHRHVVANISIFISDMRGKSCSVF